MPVPRTVLSRRLGALCIALSAIVAGPAGAWGAVGHRLVGHLAADELTPVARAEAARLLAGEPNPTLAGVSSWADELRDTDPAQGKRTGRWHYVNLAENGCAYSDAACAKNDCVVGAITVQTAILTDRARSDAERRDALKFVVHFIGDVHQPLHTAFGRDKGGNDVQVQLAPAISPTGVALGSNLHALWDSGLLKAMRQDEAAHLRRLRSLSLVVALPVDGRSPPAMSWAETSCRLAVQPGFYPASPKVDVDYAARWLPTVDQRLREAGAQLAAVLNAALGRR